MSAHTPGPWIVGEMRNKYDIVIRDSDRAPVAFGTIAGYPLREAEANARLIAASPELLDALIHIQQVACSGSPELEIANEVLAKFTGGQP